MEDPNTSMGAAVCRICMCGETSIPYLGKQAGEPLISPCRCSGTMGLYHRSCLEHWLTLTKTKNCEICKFAFKIEQKHRNFVDYIRQKGYEKRRTDPENRNPFVDFSFAIVISPLACVALYLCIRGAALAGQKYHFAFENRDNDENGRNLEIRNETSMEFALFVFVAVVLFFAYSIFLVVMFANHVTQYKKWQSKNMIIFVVDQLDAEQSLHYNPQWNKRGNGLKAKFAQFWRTIRRRPIISPEIVRGDQIPIEPIVGISPVSNAGFLHSSPQMYAEPPQKLTLSPIGLEELYVGSPSRMSFVSSVPHQMRKHSVYSVCSFGNGVVTCSTPVANQHLRVLTPTSNSVSTFKSSTDTLLDVAGVISQTDSEDTIVGDNQLGRFRVERLDTPRL